MHINICHMYNVDAYYSRSTRTSPFEFAVSHPPFSPKSGIISSCQTRLQGSATHCLSQQVYRHPIFRRCCCNSKKKRNLPSSQRNKDTWDFFVPAGVSGTIYAVQFTVYLIANTSGLCQLLRKPNNMERIKNFKSFIDNNEKSV